MELLKIKPKYLEVIENTALTNAEKLNFILEDTISYFNSSNRCIDNRGDKKGCAYSPLTFQRTYQDSEGCAVGRLFEEEDALKLDSFDCDGTIYDCLDNNRGKEIPTFFHKNKVFFTHLQSFHDIGSNWQKDGISERGKIRVEEIRKIIL